MKREFKVEVNQGAPQVTTVRILLSLLIIREVYKKQSGGRGKFADIVVTIDLKMIRENRIRICKSIKGGNIPKEFIPSVEKGFKESMKNW